MIRKKPAAISLLVLWSSGAMAQGVPSVVAPGVIERSQERRDLPPSATIDIPAPKGMEAPPNAAELRFTLSDVAIDGATVFTKADLAPLYQARLGKTATLADLYAIADAITARYVQAGYAISFAVVPAQTISGGVAHLQIVEGYVAEIQYDGVTGAARAMLDAQADKIKASRPLKSADLERYLLLANDLPGMRVRATFDRLENAARGATKLVLSIDRRPFAGSLSLNNRGSRAFGPFLLDGETRYALDLGAPSELKLRALSSLPLQEMLYGSASLSSVLNGEGINLQASVSYSRGTPGLGALRTVDFRSQGWVANARLEYPLSRTRAESLWLSGGLTMKWLRGDILGSVNSRDRIVLLQPGVSWMRKDAQGTTLIDVRVNQGLTIFGATDKTDPLASRAGNGGAHAAAILNVSRLQQVSPKVSVLLSGSAQMATHALLASEQCAYGGAAFGRGFDDSEVQGDSCAMGSAELRYAMEQSSETFGALQLYGFADAGATWKRGALPPGEEREASGLSAGLGLRFFREDGISGSVEVALPLGRDTAQEGNRVPRLFFSLTKSF